MKLRRCEPGRASAADERPRDGTRLTVRVRAVPPRAAQRRDSVCRLAGSVSDRVCVRARARGWGGGIQLAPNTHHVSAVAFASAGRRLPRSGPTGEVDGSLLETGVGTAVRDSGADSPRWNQKE